MSERTTNAATAKTSPKPAPKKAKADRKQPKLHIVDGSALRRAARRRLAFAASFLVLAATLFAVAIIYGQLVQGQQHLDDLRREIAVAEERRHQLERDVAIASAPETIVARAIELGMVRAVDPQFLIAVRDVEAGE